MYEVIFLEHGLIWSILNLNMIRMGTVLKNLLTLNFNIKMFGSSVYFTYLCTNNLKQNNMKNENDWICTDGSCNQYRKDISSKVFLFKEDRLINPKTKEIKEYQAEIDLNDYELDEIIDICSAYGYEKETVTQWVTDGSENALIAECIFEMNTDNY